MPRIISFGWTWPAIVARQKTRTRRNWDDKYAMSFKHGDICHAWDFSPRSGHGKHIADIKIKGVSYQHNGLMTEMDYLYEGFEYLDNNKHLIPNVKGSPLLKYMDNISPCRAFMNDWMLDSTYLAVVEFEILEVKNDNKA